MTVYVDDMRLTARVGRITARWSHLWADDEDELHTFAARLGLRCAWFQRDEPRRDGSLDPFWHYDVTDTKRQQAIRLGAVPVGWLDAPDLMRARPPRARDDQEEAE